MSKKKNNRNDDMNLQNDYQTSNKSNKNNNSDISEEKSERNDLNHDM